MHFQSQIELSITPSNPHQLKLQQCLSTQALQIVGGSTFSKHGLKVHPISQNNVLDIFLSSNYTCSNLISMQLHRCIFFFYNGNLLWRVHLYSTGLLMHEVLKLSMQQKYVYA